MRLKNRKYAKSLGRLSNNLTLTQKLLRLFMGQLYAKSLREFVGINGYIQQVKACSKQIKRAAKGDLAMDKQAVLRMLVLSLIAHKAVRTRKAREAARKAWETRRFESRSEDPAKARPVEIQTCACEALALRCLPI